MVLENTSLTKQSENNSAASPLLRSGVVPQKAVVVSKTFSQSIGESLESLTESISKFFQARDVKQLAKSPFQLPVKQEAKQEKVSKIRELLKQPLSAFERIKSLLPIPASVSPLLDILLKKGTKMDVKASIVNDSMVFATDVAIPGGNIKGSAQISIPLAPPAEKDTPVELHPAVEQLLQKVLAPLVPEDQKTDEILKLLSTLPTQSINIMWMKGTADIAISLPGGAVVKLTLALPTEVEAEKNPDILRTFLKSIFKENYPGIASLLAKDMVFTWNGSTSQFKIQFPQQIALQINKLELENETLLKLLGKNTTVVLPQTIAGTINFKENSVEFSPGTTFQVKKEFPLPDKDISLQKVSFDPVGNKIKLKVSTPILFADPSFDIDIDLNEPKEPKAKKPAGKSVVDFAFVAYNGPASKNASPAKKTAETKSTPVKSGISVFESMKKMVKIPEVFSPIVNMLFGHGTALDMNVGIGDDIILSSAINLPNIGIEGHARLIVPMKPEAVADAPPVELHPAIQKLLSQGLSSKITKEDELNELLDLLLTLPNQAIHFDWRGADHPATIILTLPTGVILKLDLKIPEAKEGEIDIVRGFLSKVLKDKFTAIEPLLSQSFVFKWHGSNSKFRIEFTEQQVLHLNSFDLKKGKWFTNFVGKIVGWIVGRTSVVLPRKIEGTIDFKEASVKFDKDVTFTVKSLLGFTKKVGLEKVVFNPEKKEVNLGIKCFGSHSIAIDLKSESAVEDVKFQIRSRRALRTNPFNHLMLMP